MQMIILAVLFFQVAYCSVPLIVETAAIGPRIASVAGRYCKDA